jgi:hypothetical protein
MNEIKLLNKLLNLHLDEVDDEVEVLENQQNL